MSIKNELYYNNLLTDISYNNDVEYRDILLKLFFINRNTITDIDDMDEEIFNSIYKIQDIIFKNTKDILVFQEIYDLASAKVFSTDRLTGLTILFSYDLLPYFHTVFCLFLSNPEIELFTTNNIDFIKNNELFIKVKENI
jgi:hypothetical protein